MNEGGALEEQRGERSGRCALEAAHELRRATWAPDARELGGTQPEILEGWKGFEFERFDRLNVKMDEECEWTSERLCLFENLNDGVEVERWGSLAASGLEGAFEYAPEWVPSGSALVDGLLRMM